MIVDTLDAARDLYRRYMRQPDADLYLDIETTGLDPREHTLVAVILRQGSDETAILDMRRLPTTPVAAILCQTTGRIIGHNLKFDLGFLQPIVAPVVVMDRVWDTMIAEQLMAGGEPGDFDLASVCASYGISVEKETRHWFYEPAPLDTRREEWDAPFPEEVVRYMQQDVEVLAPVLRHQTQAVRSMGLWDVATLEMQVVAALAQVENAGVLIDVEGWRDLIHEKEREATQLENQLLLELGGVLLKQRIAEYDRQLQAYRMQKAAEEGFLRQLRDAWEHANVKPWGETRREELAKWRANHRVLPSPKLDTTPPNLNSPLQLQQALTAKGIRVKSTRTEVLKGLADRYPLLQTLVAYRKATKLVTSFGETLLSKRGSDGRIHPHYLQLGASTGRMSCTTPNWQQIPSRGDGSRMRALVIPAPGSKLVTADLPAIEARVAAQMSGDVVLRDIFARGEDLHAATARLMFDLPAEWGKKETAANACPVVSGASYRDVGKTINYGLFFGMSEKKLARTLNTTPEVAADLMAKYFAAFPTLVGWLAEQKENIHGTGETRTLLGRIRSLRIDPQADEFEGYRVERQAMNAPIQGTAADIIKWALVMVSYMLDDCDLDAYVIAVVHDEIVVECAEEHAVQVQEVLATSMNKACAAILPDIYTPPIEATIADYWSK